jgi:hypothetical protein
MCIPCLGNDDIVEWRMAVPEPGKAKFNHHDGPLDVIRIESYTWLYADVVAIF